MVKIKPKSFCFEVLVLNFLFLIFFAFSCFNLFVLFVFLFICDITCLFKLRFSLFDVLKHVMLLDLIVLFLLCFVLVVSGLGFGRVCIPILEVCGRIQLGCVHKPYVCIRVLKPENPNLHLFAFVPSLHL